MLQIKVLWNTRAQDLDRFVFVGKLYDDSLGGGLLPRSSIYLKVGFWSLKSIYLLVWQKIHWELNWKLCFLVSPVILGWQVSFFEPRFPEMIKVVIPMSQDYGEGCSQVTDTRSLTADLLKSRGIGVTLVRGEGPECLLLSASCISWFMDIFANLWHFDTGEASSWMNLELCPVLVNLRGDSVSSAGENSKTILYGKERTCENVYLISKYMESPV